MLALGMAFIAKPKLLIIDELSLGLAPTIVEQLLEHRARASTRTARRSSSSSSRSTSRSRVADRAYFMEKGEVRFSRRRPPSCSSATTSCARCSSPAQRSAAASPRPHPRA